LGWCFEKWGSAPEMGCGAKQGMMQQDWVLGRTDVYGALGLLLASTLHYGVWLKRV